MKTVLCHGVFDVLHAGHLAYFQEAKSYGEKLIVSITADRFVNKGPGRPYFSAEKRKRMLESLREVDEVFITEEHTGINAIERVKPDFYVKGPDYRNADDDVTGEILNERQAVEKHGGKLVFTTGEMFSSSTLVNKYFANWSDDQRNVIERVKHLGGFETIKLEIEKLAKLNVLVVGEPITDIYRFVRPEGISSKSPSISCRFEFEEHYEGGSLAIANHLEDFCETYADGNTGKAPTKIRYLSSDKQQRIFEVTHIDESIWNHERIAENILKLNGKMDAIILADFGHGLFDGAVMEALNEMQGFVGLNVQTNSSNFGFNVYTKHRAFNYLCLDTRESRLATHDRQSHPLSVAHKIASDIKRPFGFTTGPTGAYLLYGANTFYSPAFSDVVVDATGAGDAYFAITTILLASGCKPELVPFIGNVFAGLKTKIIGNKESVSKASLLKACQAILK